METRMWRSAAGLWLAAAMVLAGCGGGGGSKNAGTQQPGPVPPAAVSVNYVSAAPDLLFLAGAPGPTRAELVFRVVDAMGAPAAGQDVRLQLANALLGTSLENAGADGTVLATSDAEGEVVAVVRAGTVPGAVRVLAALAATPGIATSSLELRIATGRPSQANSSLAVTVSNIEGAAFDGAETELTMSLADRQGNPVPDGVQVNFVVQAGAVFPASCITTGGSSRCSVTLRSQGSRTADGLVRVLAYTPGEEPFTDLNGNNAWDADEPFVDLGDAFRDDNGNGIWDAGEFQVQRGGTLPCAGTLAEPVPSRAGTCDGRWGETEVRRQTVVAFSSGRAVFSAPRALGSGRFAITLSDVNGNALPAGTALSADVRAASDTSSCQAELDVTSVPNGLLPTAVEITTRDCAGDTVLVTARSPSGVTTTQAYVVN